MALDNSSLFCIKLSAPGKVILFGEYSVIFNRPAIAATLSLKTKLNFFETSNKLVHLKFSALNIDKCFALNDIQKFMKWNSDEDWDTYLLAIKNSFLQLYENTYGVFDLNDSQKNSLITFFHCFGNCFQNYTNIEGFHLIIDSQLPVNSGVGSSASFSVVLSAASIIFESYLKRDGTITTIVERNNECINLTESSKNIISDLAFSCEKIFHGSPSGVDNNTVLRGSMIEFIKLGNESKKITSIDTCSIKVLLVNTNIQRSTRKNVEHVKELKKNHQDIIECILNAMENIALMAVDILKSLKNNFQSTNKIESRFENLITLNHGLLRVLGVSHPALENIVEIANKYNLSSKLTGAGGGGFAFIYIPTETENSVIRNVEKDLTEAGYSVVEVVLGGPGVLIEELNV